MTTFVSRFDFRAPGADRATRQELYGRALEQAAYLDEHGHDAILISEHHASDDGYLPSPLVVTAAVAARTSRIPITVSALLVNFYEPVKLAEDVAMLDHLSGGRVSYTLGLGYRPEEYALFGRPWESRGADIERRIELLLALWRGEEVAHDGRQRQHLAAPVQRAAPVPVLRRRLPRRRAKGRAPRPELPAQRRRQGAARPLRRRVPRDTDASPGFVLLPPTGPGTVFCAEDPDRFWASYGEHLLADAMAYRAWSGPLNSLITDDSTTVEELRAGGRYVVLTPDDWSSSAGRVSCAPSPATRCAAACPPSRPGRACG